MTAEVLRESLAQPMPRPVAAAIYRDVLTATYRAANTVEGSPALIVHCRCHDGRCGHCMAGRHQQCTTRLRGPLVGPEAYVTGRRGEARTAVWLSGTPCRWVCSCVCPPAEPETHPALFDAGPAATKRDGQPETRRHKELFGQLGLFDLAGGGS